VKNEADFYDEYVDNFVHKYANFSNYFSQREINKYRLIAKVRIAVTVAMIMLVFRFIFSFVDD